MTYFQNKQLYTFGFSRTSSSWVVNRETFHFSREIKIAMSSASDTGPSEHYMLGVLGNLPQSLMLPLRVLHTGEPAAALKLPLRAWHAGPHAENSSTSKTSLISFKIRQIATTMHLINKILRGRMIWSPPETRPWHHLKRALMQVFSSTPNRGLHTDNMVQDWLVLC